ncbi:MAG: DEAD/DEAH box helicase [Agriterribacter sp.]
MELLDQYKELLARKIKVAQRNGFKIDRSNLHPSNKPHQNDIIERCIGDGAGLIAADTGLGKTAMAIEICRIILSTERLLYSNNKKALIVTELGAAETFINKDPEVGEGARLGIDMSYVTNQGESDTSNCDIVVTNYERVRMGCFDFSRFSVVCLDEGNYIKNMASETTDMLTIQLAKVKYKYIFTATPSPNETLELINYAHVLGIADRGGILTRFFQRDSTKAGELTIHPQHKEDFWLWVYSWAIFIQFPSDLGYDDEGYLLPALNVYWHEVKLDKPVDPKPDRDGQTKMFADASGSLPEAAKLKRLSIDVRLNAARKIMLETDPDESASWIIWHHLEDERKAINKLFKDHPSYADVYGTLNWKEKEKRIVDFSKGSLQILATKPEISGVGCNFQKYCHNNIVLGVFQTMGFHYIPTDVVAENNQTYRLTYGEMQKDSTKMGSGIPEEIWLFRKPPTSRDNAYADVPVTHNMVSCPACNYTGVVNEFFREGALLVDCPGCKQFFQPDELKYYGDKNYTLSKWQIDADSFWKSSGDRLLQPDELMGMSMKQVRKWWNKFNSTTIYDFENHVKLLQLLDDKGRLSRTYTTLPLRSNTPFIWNDVNRMHGLNLEQARRKQQNHICPQPSDEIDRIIDLYSNEGERVDDCFGGLGSTGVRAIKKKRTTKIVELNGMYTVNAKFYLKQAEDNINTPTLFDLIEMEAS